MVSLAVIPASRVVRQQNLWGATNFYTVILKPLHSLPHFHLPWTCGTAAMYFMFFTLNSIKSWCGNFLLFSEVKKYTFPLFTVRLCTAAVWQPRSFLDLWTVKCVVGKFFHHLPVWKWMWFNLASNAWCIVSYCASNILSKDTVYLFEQNRKCVIVKKRWEQKEK